MVAEVDDGKIRLKDLAEHAGVSTATVSRVLNTRPGVSDAARQRVLAALDVLGYERPERLRPRRKGLVGLIIPELTNPIFPEIAQAVETLLNQRGYTTLLCTQSPGGTTEDEYLAVLLEHEVDGIIVVSGLNADTTASHDRYHHLRARGIPLAFVNGLMDDVEAAYVAHDDLESMDLAVRYLVSLGHTNIGLASGPHRFTPTQRKIDGFRRAVARYLPGTDESLEPTGDLEPSISLSLYTLEGGQAAGTDLIRRGYTAIVCGSDLMAMGVVRAARALGKAVPADISVIGFDDAPFTSFSDPPLTTIRLATTEMSHAVVSALVAEINGESAPRAELLFRPELIVRSSTGANPALVPSTPTPARGPMPA